MYIGSLGTVMDDDFPEDLYFNEYSIPTRGVSLIRTGWFYARNMQRIHGQDEALVAAR